MTGWVLPTLMLFLCSWNTVLAKEVTIRWEPLEHAVQCEIRIQNKGKELLTQRLHSAKTQWKGELPPGFYVYQLRAMTARPAPATGPSSTRSLCCPPRRRGKSPGNGDTVRASHPKDEVVLEWNSAKGADRYFVKVTREGSDVYAGTVTETKKSLSGLKGGKYEWEVQSVVVADDKAPPSLNGREWKTTGGRAIEIRFALSSSQSSQAPVSRNSIPRHAEGREIEMEKSERGGRL